MTRLEAIHAAATLGINYRPDVRDLAAKMNSGTSTLYRWIAEGKIKPPTKLPGTRRATYSPPDAACIILGECITEEDEK